MNVKFEISSDSTIRILCLEKCFDQFSRVSLCCLPVHIGWLKPFSTWELHNDLGFFNGVRFV